MSTYMHASLYSFSEKARDQIIQEFANTIRDVSVKCDYDFENDYFEIRCPSVVGQHANEVFAQIIKRRIDEHEASEERSEDELIRFPASKFDALDSFVESNADHDQGSRPRPSASCPVARTHIIMSDVDLIKVFRIHDLDGFGLLERTLAPLNAKTAALFSSALTCRAARFDPNDGYVFNGRTGKHHHIAHDNTTESSSPTFPDFRHLRDDRIISEDRNDGPVGDQWEMEPADEEVGVNKWLAGVGRTQDVQVDPFNARPELPKDTKQLLAKEQTYAKSRARVPRGAKVIASDIEESDEDSDENTRPAVRFGAFLATNRFVQTAQVEVQARSFSSEASDETERGPSFQSLLPGGSLAAKKRRGSGDWSAVIHKPAPEQRAAIKKPEEEQRAVVKVQAATSKNAATQKDSTPPPSSLQISRSRAAPFRPDREWASYGKDYAKTDKIGLKGNATNNAKWEVEHGNRDQELQQHYSRLGPVIVRSTAATISSMPPSTRGDSVASISDAEHASTAKPIRCYDDWDPREAEWVNQPGPATSGPQPKLIDDRVDFLQLPIKVPPGLLQRQPPGQVRVQTSPAFEKPIDLDDNAMDCQNVKPSTIIPHGGSNVVLTPK